MKREIIWISVRGRCLSWFLPKARPKNLRVKAALGQKTTSFYSGHVGNKRLEKKTGLSFLLDFIVLFEVYG